MNEYIENFTTKKILRVDMLKNMAFLHVRYKNSSNYRFFRKKIDLIFVNIFL